MLYPEAAFAPSGIRATVASAIVITAVLVLGSMLLVTPFTAPVSLCEPPRADPIERD
jgi:hypothetical protein